VTVTSSLVFLSSFPCHACHCHSLRPTAAGSNEVQFVVPFLIRLSSTQGPRVRVGEKLELETLEIQTWNGATGSDPLGGLGSGVSESSLQ
jgi:hypothetical protein